MHHNGTYTSSLMHHIWSRLQGTASTALDTDHALGTLCEMILFTIYVWTIIEAQKYNGRVIAVNLCYTRLIDTGWQ